MAALYKAILTATLFHINFGAAYSCHWQALQLDYLRISKFKSK